jgi:hypothetical protein
MTYGIREDETVRFNQSTISLAVPNNFTKRHVLVVVVVVVVVDGALIRKQRNRTNSSVGTNIDKVKQL